MKNHFSFKLRLLIPFFALLLILLIGLSSCQSSQDISKEGPPPPCNDKLYVALQSRDSSTYSEFEKDYFRKMRDECSDAVSNGVKKKEHDEKQAVGEKIVLGVAIALGVVGAAILFLILAWKGN